MAWSEQQRGGRNARETLTTGAGVWPSASNGMAAFPSIGGSKWSKVGNAKIFEEDVDPMAASNVDFLAADEKKGG
ncbi:hypothetical protein E2562_005542 [Oryza meyeriana var. granulata]|uniref:Uncharacterized protein n=1 Tax=Oryza meyeriana var. granulata TaxID=110450 RepID=A0A6G1F423_9ORYZ|nr:hypothetical protein E2562_005542 [Oryza meyeriana var. granulata]